MILVTGASGFLGQHLVRELSAGSAPLIATAHRINTVADDLRLPNVEWKELDVLDVAALEVLMQNVSHVYHCAGVVSFESYDHDRMMRVNATGTANVVNAALACGVKKMLHVSSVAALGRSNEDAVIMEATQWKNGKQNSTYALSKYLAEREMWRGMQEGLPAVIVNPTVIIGSGDWRRGTARLFHAARRGMPFYPTGANGFVSVEDVVSCIIKLMDGPFANERYILNGENITYKEFFTLVTKNLNVSSPRFALPRIATRAIWLMSSLLHKTTGVSPLLTRETARTVNGTYRYSNAKVSAALGHRFIPAKEFITQTARQFKP